MALTTEDLQSIEGLLRGFATKDDLKEGLAQCATKDDLKGFATKDDLKGFATHDDLKSLATKIDGLDAHLTTRIDNLDIKIDGVESRLIEEIKRLDIKVDRLGASLSFGFDLVQRDTFERLDDYGRRITKLETKEGR